MYIYISHTIMLSSNVMRIEIRVEYTYPLQQRPYIFQTEIFSHLSLHLPTTCKWSAGMKTLRSKLGCFFCFLSRKKSGSVSSKL